MPAADIIGLVEALKAPYGLERSVKITQGMLADDRCLISVGRSALGEDAGGRLLRMARALDLPARFAQELPAALDRADVVHFGYETVAGRDIYKVYCEYAASARQAMASAARTPTLVHQAYKWMPGEPDSGAVTRYTWVPYDSRIELEQKLGDLVPAEAAPRAHRCAFALVARVPALVESREMLLMEVDEPGNPRRSCDLNVYDAELQMSDVADVIDAALTDFAIPEVRRRATFNPARERMLGHLSAGRGRDGAEFVTIYFGVEAH
jgi:tryptophan 7-halogenase